MPFWSLWLPTPCCAGWYLRKQVCRAPLKTLFSRQIILVTLCQTSSWYVSGFRIIMIDPTSVKSPLACGFIPGILPCLNGWSQILASMAGDWWLCSASNKVGNSGFAPELDKTAEMVQKKVEKGWLPIAKLGELQYWPPIDQFFQQSSDDFIGLNKIKGQEVEGEWGCEGAWVPDF